MQTISTPPVRPTTIELRASARLPLVDVCNPTFLQSMVNRCIVGYHRYGPFHAIGRHSKSDRLPLDRARECLDKYKYTGNLEYLIDIANYCMAEFTAPHHPKAHYSPADQGKGIQPH